MELSWGGGGSGAANIRKHEAAGAAGEEVAPTPTKPSETEVGGEPMKMLETEVWDTLRRRWRTDEDVGDRGLGYCAIRRDGGTIRKANGTYKFYNVEKQIDWSSFQEYCRDRGLKYPLMVKRLACQVISNKIPHDIFEILHGEKRK